MFFWSIDPFAYTGLFNIKSHLVLGTLDFPFHLSAQVMIAYAWNAAIKAIKDPGLEIMKKIRIPMIICIIFMFAAGLYQVTVTDNSEIYASVSRCLFVSVPTAALGASALLYVLLFTVTTVYFVVSGSRLVLFFKQSSVRADSKRQSSMNRVSSSLFLTCRWES